MRKYATLLLLCCLAACAPPPTPPESHPESAKSPAKKVVRAEGVPPSGAPFSPGILVGDTLYLSGSIGRDPATGKLVEGGLEPEMRQVLANLEAVLKAADMGLKDVVSVTTYLVDSADFARYNEIYRETFQEPFPVRATVTVKELAGGASIEISAIAVRGR